MICTSWAIKRELLDEINGFRPVVGFDDHDVTTRLYAKTGIQYKKIDVTVLHKIGSFKGFIRRQFTIGMKEIEYRRQINDKDYFNKVLPIRFIALEAFLLLIIIGVPILLVALGYYFVITLYYWKYLVYIGKEKGTIIQIFCNIFYLAIPILSLSGGIYGMTKDRR